MSPESGHETISGTSDFVVVANRLPVDLERLPTAPRDGSGAPVAW